MIFADLHAHTTASDGSLTPTELARAAVAAGLSYLAVTDHDTTAGVEEAIRAARGTGLSVVPGVELSAEGAPGKCHLLGLGVDYRHDELNATLERLSEHRRTRNHKILARLTALGVPVTMDEVLAVAPEGANIGRPHIAEALVRRGHVADAKVAFTNYLRDGGPAYVEKETLTPAEAARLIHEAGGFCCLAHPGLLRLEKHETDERRIIALKAVGMDGLEVYYSKHSYAQTGRFLRLAEKHRLLVTGGADFHGDAKPEVRLGYVRYNQRLPADAISRVLLDRALTDVPGDAQTA
jgi:3',5'-nucleoside bisphosphate phosphatase